LPFAVAGLVLVLTVIPAMLMARRTQDLKIKPA
jgi:NADH:ubiquinone oxidoreductase subunit 6 (subunit J)